MKDKIYRNSDKLKELLIVGLIIEIIAFIGFCFEISAFKFWFWIGSGTTILGSMFFIDYYGSEGKTWFQGLDSERMKNITRKSSETIFFISIISTLIFCSPFIVEFFIKDFSTRLYVMAIILVVSIIEYILIKYIVKKTQEEMDEVIINRQENTNKKKK